jgi:hypothetical protein
MSLESRGLFESRGKESMSASAACSTVTGLGYDATPELLQGGLLYLVCDNAAYSKRHMAVYLSRRG